MGNRVLHWELMSKDPAKGAEFYAKIFGWKVNHIPEFIAARTGKVPGRSTCCSTSW